MHTQFIARRLPAVLLVAVSLAIATGCSDKLALHPVRGQVLHEGQPCINALVALHPVGSPKGMENLRPYGRVQHDGYFTLTTYEGGDGAPAGEYVVTVSWPAPLPGASPTDEDPEIAMGGPDQLEKRYNDAQTSTLRATVVAGENAPIFEVE